MGHHSRRSRDDRHHRRSYDGGYHDHRERSRSRHWERDRDRDRSRSRRGHSRRSDRRKGHGRDRKYRDRSNAYSRDRDKRHGKSRRDKSRSRSPTDQSRSRSRERSRRRRDRSRDRDKNRYDDDEGHLIIKIGADVTERYKIVEELGEGTFGKVVKCVDRDARRGDAQHVAIKIVKNIQRYRDAAEIEIDILKALQKGDPEGQHYVIHLKRTFDFRNHVCMVFDVMGLSVFDFLKNNGFRPFPIEHVRTMAHQLLIGIQYMHSIKLTHTDLKPENILLVDSSADPLEVTAVTGTKSTVSVLRSADIRLIDLGSATWEDQHHTRIVSTRHYRAPEVILELGWSYPCDMWSIGCILIEMFTGDALFQTHENLEHLAMMEAILGPIPRPMLKSTKKSKYLIDGKLAWPQKASSTSSVRYVETHCRPLEELVPFDDQVHLDFVDLLKGLLEYDPDKRTTASQALEHPFFLSAD